MLTLARLAARPVARIPIATTSYALARHYSDEPGPSTSRDGAKTRKRQLRNTVVEHVGKNKAEGLSLDALQMLLDASPSSNVSKQPAREPKIRTEAEGKELGTGVPDGRRRPRDDWVTRQTGKKDQTPYDLSQKLHKWIDRHTTPLTPAQIDEVEGMVSTAPSPLVNAAVYNLVLALFGREGKYQRMWKLFNNMKKRGVRPTSRTFTTLLNAYAGLAHSGIEAGQFTPSHPPELRTIDRVRVIYEQSQAHIRAEMAKGEPDDDGLGATGKSGNVRENQINVLPTNAYLKFLARFGMWDEMERVFLAMDVAGPLAPDQRTYFTMLKTIANITVYNSHALEDSIIPTINVGSATRGYWDRAVRQLSPKPGRKNLDDSRKVDEALVLAAMQCFSLGGPADHKIVEQLIPRLYRLPVPGQPASSGNTISTASDLPDAWAYLPSFPLSVATATTLMSVLKRMDRKSLTSHYTHILLDDKRLQKNFDLPALRAAVHNLADAGDADAAIAVLDMYQPPSGKDGWPLDVWHAVLSAARWSTDWEAALSMFRRMVHLPNGIELGEHGTPYNWTPPNGNKLDIRGRPWIASRPMPADVRSIDLLLKTALAAQRNSGIKPLRQAVTIFEHFATDIWTVTSNIVDSRGRHVRDDNVDLLQDSQGDMTKSTKRSIAERLDLAADLETATERLLEVPKSDQDRERLIAMQKKAQRVQRYWAWVKDKMPTDVRRRAIAARGLKPDPPREREIRSRRDRSDTEGSKWPRRDGDEKPRLPREERTRFPRERGEGHRFQRNVQSDQPRFQRREASEHPRFERGERRPRHEYGRGPRSAGGGKPRFGMSQEVPSS